MEEVLEIEALPILIKFADQRDPAQHVVIVKLSNLDF